MESSIGLRCVLPSALPSPAALQSGMVDITELTILCLAPRSHCSIHRPSEPRAQILAAFMEFLFSFYLITMNIFKRDAGCYVNHLLLRRNHSWHFVMHINANECIFKLNTYFCLFCFKPDPSQRIIFQAAQIIISFSCRLMFANSSVCLHFARRSVQDL